MAKKKAQIGSAKRSLRKPEAALSGVGIGSLVRIMLLAALGIGGAVLAIWVHYRKPFVPPHPAPSATPTSSDGIEYIDIDVDASVLP